LDYVRRGLINDISQDGQKDGMDGILLKITKGDEKINLEYAAANNAPILITNGEVQELSKDKMPIGIGIRKDSFQTFSIQAKKGDMLYLYTDGFADQFGGPKGKKFKYKALNELLLLISELQVEEQKLRLNQTFDEWKGELEQVDDVCIIGIRI